MPRNSLKKTHTVLEIETANKAKVLEARKRRIRGVVEELTPAAGIGAAWGAIIAGIKNPSFSKGCAIIAGGAATVLAINTLNEYSKGSQKVREATKLMGKGIYQEARRSQLLRDALMSTKYVYVNKDGKVVFTNRPRILGIGRIRLETKKILNGEYK
jgi:hypothetical protein